MTDYQRYEIAQEERRLLEIQRKAEALSEQIRKTDEMRTKWKAEEEAKRRAETGAASEGTQREQDDERALARLKAGGRLSDDEWAGVSKALGNHPSVQRMQAKRGVNG